MLVPRVAGRRLAWREVRKMLDAGNTLKQSRRTHLYIKVEVGIHEYYIPLRNNLGNAVRKFGLKFT